MSKLTPGDLQVKRQQNDGKVSYYGTREQILEAGVAVDAMFPPPGGKRRWRNSGGPGGKSGTRNEPVQDQYCVSLKRKSDEGSLFLVTREIGWENPEQLQRNREAAEKERTETVKQRKRAFVLAETRRRLRSELRKHEPTSEKQYRENLARTVNLTKLMFDELLRGENPSCFGWKMRCADDLFDGLERALDDISDADAIAPPNVNVTSEGSELRVTVGFGKRS